MVFLFFLFLLGLSIGSFVNVVVYRVNNEGSPLVGRSYCPKCKRTLSWYDLIPLLSFVVLLGKCRYCGKKISWQYPIVELAMGTLAVFLWQNQVGDLSHLSNLRILTFLTLFLIFSSFLVIFVSDLLYQKIPFWVVVFGVLASIAYAASSFQLPASSLLVGICSFSFFLFLTVVTRGKGMGFGDTFLAFLIGFFLGWPKAIIAFYLAFLTGALIGVILILLGKKRFGEHIAFGPFLAGATFVAFFWGNILWHLVLIILGMDLH